MAEYEPVPIPDGTPRETDGLHEALQLHISTCDQCRTAIDQSGPKAVSGFGKRTRMCHVYLETVQFFANGGR